MKKKTEKMMANIKSRQQKEQVGGAGAFNPVHYKATHGEDPESPNQYAHKVSEAVSKKGTASSLGGRHTPRKNIFKNDLLPSQRTRWQHSGNQKMRGRYTEEEMELKNKVLKKFKKMKEEQTNTKTQDLGSPDTGGKSDTVTVNPTKKELTGPLK
jgi:hypothetical protein